MRRMRIFQWYAVGLACLTGIVPQAVHASGAGLQAQSSGMARPQMAGGLVRDVALQPGGVLRGQVLDARGLPQLGVQVLVRQNRRSQSVRTTADGSFRVEPLGAGVYQIETPAAIGVYRLWAPGTAPPAARDQLLLVEDGQVVRGGPRGRHPLGFLANPWVLGGIVAAAIAIPLALDRKSEKRPAS